MNMISFDRRLTDEEYLAIKQEVAEAAKRSPNLILLTGITSAEHLCQYCGRKTESELCPSCGAPQFCGQLATPARTGSTRKFGR